MPFGRATATRLLVTAVLCVGLVTAQSAAQTAEVESFIGDFDRMLNSTSRTMATLVKTETGPSAGECPGTGPLNYACGPGSGGSTMTNIDFSAPLPASIDYVQVKRVNAYTTQTNNALARMCAMTQLGRDSWNTTRQSGAGDVLYQYYASADNLFGVYPSVTWNCSAPYLPTERPYFVAGATGQKDLVILIDISNTGDTAVASARVALAKHSAVLLLKSLSFRDFVTVLPYAQVVNTTFTPDPVQATTANVEALIQQLTNEVQVTPPGSGPNMGSATSAAINALTAGRASGLSSTCTQVIVYLASNASNTGSQDPVQLLASNPSIIAFVLMVDPQQSSSASPTLDLRKIACIANGLADVIADDSSADGGVVLVNDYFTTLLQNDVVRWSEVYTDAFGQGQILSGALPLYGLAPGASPDDTPTKFEGLVVMDVPLTNLSLGGTLNSQAVNRILLNRQTCTDLDQAGEGKSLVSAMQGTTCSGINAVSPEELELRKIRGGLITANVFGMLLLLVLPFVAFAIRTKNASGDIRSVAVVNVALSILQFIAWIVWMVLFWNYTYDDLTALNGFDEVEYTAVRYEENPFRCCSVYDCNCGSYTGTESCGTMMRELREGSCGNGYRCCRQSCRQCNCRTVKSGKKRRRKCSRCCSCVSSVANERCSVRCGTCYKPTVTVTYTYKGEQIVTVLTGSCGMDDYSCAQAWFEPHPLNTPKQGFIDPSTPRSLYTNIELRMNYFAPAIVFLVIAVLCSIGALVQTIVRTKTATAEETYSSPQQSEMLMSPAGAGGKTAEPYDERPAWEKNAAGGGRTSPIPQRTQPATTYQQPPVAPYQQPQQRTAQPDYSAL